MTDYNAASANGTNGKVRSSLAEAWERLKQKKFSQKREATAEPRGTLPARTELEYVVTFYHGPPIRRQSRGVSYWPCPNCGHRSFHTRPIKPGIKHRASCWKCDFWGDVAGMIRHFNPGL